MLFEPIKLTLYDPKTQEPVKEFEQKVITFETMLSAIQLEEILMPNPKKERRWWWQNPINEEKKQIEAVLRLVVAFFGDQFTLKELKEGADVNEVMAILRAITGRAGRIVNSNPTKPPLTRK